MNQINRALNRVLGSLESGGIVPDTALLPGENRRVAVLRTRIEGLDNFPDVADQKMIKRLITLITEELTSCVATCGGEFEQAGQNEFVALFGATKLAERSCQRAIDCGFRILNSLDMISKSINSEMDLLNFSGKVGIAWGPATVTRDSQNTTVVHGECVKLAELLERSAPSGTLLVSEKTRLSCEHIFRWKEFSEVATHNIWIPREKDDSPSVHPLISNTPLLGRDREMEHLTSAYNSYLKWFNHPPIIITGKPGTGKTRLVDAFLSTISSKDTRIVRLNNRLWDQPPLGTWLPLMKQGTFDPYGTIMSKIRELRTSHNLIIVIEDLHWADPASLKLLNQLGRSLCDAGVFLLLTSRTNLNANLEASSEKLIISGLDRQCALCLLESVLGSPEGLEGERFADFLMLRTGGNPLLITELILHAVEAGIIGRDSENNWYLDKNPDLIISNKSESLLHARLSILRPGESTALQIASVLGNGFKEYHFNLIYSKLVRRSGNITLSKLKNTGFINTDIDGHFNFTNSITLETVYETILEENKKVIHRIAAEVLSENLTPGEETTRAISLARHWTESGSGDEAVPWLFLAMEQCLDAGDVKKSETHSLALHERIGNGSPYLKRLQYFDMRLYMITGKFQLAIDLAEKIKPLFHGRELAQIYSFLAQARENLGMPLKEVLKYYILAAETAESSGDKNIAAGSLGAAGAVYLALGKRTEALSALNKALEYEAFLDTPALARLHGNMGILMQRSGSMKDALTHYSRTHELGKKCGNMSIEANSLAYMGQVNINMGKKSEGIEKYREALTIHRRTGNKRGECITLGNLGGQLARYGESENAIENLERAIHLAEEIGHTRGIMSFHSNISLAYKQAGQYKKAERHIRKSLDMIKKTEDRGALAIGHLNLSGVLSKMGRIKKAIDEARISLRYACAVNALTTQAEALGNLGSLMQKTDRLEMSINFFKEAFKRSSLAEDHATLARYVIGESRSLLEMGKAEEARYKYNEAVRLTNIYGIDFEGESDLKELEELIGKSNNKENAGNSVPP